MVYGDYKGVPKDEVRKGLDSGLDVVLRIDVQGAATIRRMVRQAVAIFLVASSEEEMVDGTSERKTEEAGTLALRIATAREELQRLDELKSWSSTARMPRRDRAPGDEHHDRRALPG